MSDQPTRNQGVQLDEAQPARTINVSGSTDCKGLAGTIAQEVRDALEGEKPRTPNIVLSAIGAGAISQAVKAVPIANTFLVSKGVILVIFPTFLAKVDQARNDGHMTVINMRLMVWKIGG